MVDRMDQRDSFIRALSSSIALSKVERGDFARIPVPDTYIGIWSTSLVPVALYFFLCK